MAKMKRLWRCPECGSADVECEAWINVNTEAVTSVNENSEYWCPECEDHFGRVCSIENRPPFECDDHPPSNPCPAHKKARLEWEGESETRVEAEANE